MDISSEIFDLARALLKKVRKSGPENIMALCPFHVKADGTEEKHPSFAMSLVHGAWFCHSCQQKGTLRGFLRDYGFTQQQISMRYSYLIEEALKNKPAVNNPLRVKVFSDNPIDDALLGIFDNCPIGLLNAGFQENTLRHFEIGFDEHHYRVTYPIRDLGGKLVAISGRSMHEDYLSKYKIYEDEYLVWDLPARKNWDKRTVLWNSHAVFQEVYFNPAPESVLVVEGFKACMWAWQSGIKNVVALLGTYLSYEQQWILEKFGAPVYLFLDNNAPGQRGMVKAADRLKTSLPVHIVEYPSRISEDEDAQPDTCTPEELNNAVQNAKNYFDWRAQ